MIRPSPTALIAEDEPLLRESLESLLKQAWPELTVVARARNGREAIDQFEALGPTVCFLDVQMPGVTGVEAAQHIGNRHGQHKVPPYITLDGKEHKGG